LAFDWQELSEKKRRKILTPQSNQTTPSQIYGESKICFCEVTLISVSLNKENMTTLSILDVTDLISWALPARGIYTHFPTEQEAAEVTIVVSVNKLWRQDPYFICLFK